MNQKKPRKALDSTFLQKINTISDWIIRLVIINIMMILTSLPIITLYPSLSAGYRLWHDYVNKNETKLFSGYFTYFKEAFMKKFIIGIILTLLIILGYLDAIYYAQVADQSWLFQIGYYVMIAVLSTGIIITLFTLVVFIVFPETKIQLMFKLSLYLAGKFFFRLVLLFLVMVIPVVMLLFPVTQLMLVFIGVSGPMLLHVLITKKVVLYLEGLKNNDES